MFWALVGLATIVVTSLICYLGAVLFVRAKTENQAWSSLWAAGLIVTLSSPVIGLAILKLAPVDIATLTQDLPFHAALPIFIASGPVDQIIETSSARFDFAWMGTFVLSIYILGALFGWLRLWIGRREVRRIAQSAVPAKIRATRSVFLSDDAETPFVWTPFGCANRSRIVLPESYVREFSADQIDLILEHESAHIDRRDDEWGLVLRAILSVLWIAPFAHFAFRRWVQACELQCDAAILRGVSKQVRADYAHVLLSALRITANRVRQYPAATFSNDRLRNEKMRITNIMSGNAPVIKRTRSQVSLVLAAVSVSVASGVGFASVANADPVGVSAGDVKNVTLESIVAGRLTAPFGKTFDPFRDGSTRVHLGVDIGAPIGTKITAPADGIIVEATDLYDGKPNYGKVVVIATANSTQTLFSHLNAYSVTTGQQVRKGDVIAEVGNTGKSTGPHVHIETHVSGERVDPLSVWNTLD